MTPRPPGWLKRHPFAVEAFFERSVVLTYAFPEARLGGLLPACLSLDTDRTGHAFVAVAAVQTTGLRPRGFPPFLGRDFLLVGYRVFARYVNRAGRRLRGLYILRSETDRKSMELLGNLFTRYRYLTTAVTMKVEGRLTSVRCDASGLAVTVERGDGDEPPLPDGSAFHSWTEARRFAGPLPFTFSVEPGSRDVVIIEGVRQSWEPRPVRVVEHRVPFVASLCESTPMLASAFTIEGVPYRWKKGVVERWRS